MHLLIPFASGLSDAAVAGARSLQLPHLERLLAALEPTTRIGSDEFSLNAPHELALARLHGWQVGPGDDGRLPLAALAAERDGIDTAGLAVGLLTPAHWHAGAEKVSMHDPDDLQLDANDSRALLEALRPLFEDHPPLGQGGWRVAWGAPLRWYVMHDSLASLATASPDRVIARNVDRWLPGQDAGRALRRLQVEVQMLLYTHPVNEAREAAGAPPVNSIWLSGSGKPQATRAPQDLVVIDSLRRPALHEDWHAWIAAWKGIDTGEPLRRAHECLRRGEPFALTLAGERHAQTFEPSRAGLWGRLASRWRKTALATTLETL